ncbi:hypothetical protein VNI00_014077 [Paramarasmius palmivorus]|uniref:MARVEL domain-containing protein n=1 Tax=Paramarasmius palmivorus TaxID=297713 RepID=A0AAW0BVY4_9AGAR
MSPISITRSVTFGLATLFGLIILALNADLLAVGNQYGDYTVFDFQGLGVAVGIMNLLVFPTFLVVGAIRKNAIVTSNIVELPVIGILILLWIVESALISRLAPPGGFQCDALKGYGFQGDDVAFTSCQKLVAVQAFSFLAWIHLMLYTFLAIGLCLAGKASWHAGETSPGTSTSAKPTENTTYATGA